MREVKEKIKLERPAGGNSMVGEEFDYMMEPGQNIKDNDELITPSPNKNLIHSQQESSMVMPMNKNCLRSANKEFSWSEIKKELDYGFNNNNLGNYLMLDISN